MIPARMRSAVLTTQGIAIQEMDAPSPQDYRNYRQGSSGEFLNPDPTCFWSMAVLTEVMVVPGRLWAWSGAEM